MTHDTATERLASWVEYHLKPFAQQHVSCIKIGIPFSKHLENTNETKAPSSDSMDDTAKGGLTQFW